MKKLFVLLVVFLSNVQAQETKEISRDWISFSQFLDIKTDIKIDFILKASVKVDGDDDQTWAGLWARVDQTNEDEIGFFDNMAERPIVINEWRTYEIKGYLDSNSKRLNFGGLCINNGKFYFDDFHLFIENKDGEMEEVEIDNPSFENQIVKGQIPKWSLGIEKGKIVKIKEFEINSTTDKTVGNLGLLITGSGITPEITSIGDKNSDSPQISAMISMLEDLKNRVENKVKSMSQYEIDHLHDEKANRIGALILHLAAAEKYYQVFTFEGRGFNDEEQEKWGDALSLGQTARDKFKGKDIQYYLDIYNEVRAETITELKKRDDEWFSKVQPSYGVTNQYCWFHVMEHQSSHLGQILFLAKRIPPQPEIKNFEKIKD